MKRSTASTSLNPYQNHFENCDDIDSGKIVNKNSKPENNKENKIVTFSDQDSDESIFKPPLQSTSSGYYSLDETEGDMSRSYSSKNNSYKNSDISNTTFKPERVSTAKKGFVSKSNTECYSAANFSLLQSFDSFCHANKIEKMSNTTENEGNQMIPDEIKSQDNLLVVPSSNYSYEDAHHTKLRSPDICKSCRGSFAEWEETYNICEKTILNQTKRIIENEVKLSQKEEELMKINRQLEEVKIIKEKMAEKNEQLSNCLLAINNILILEEDDVLRSQINEVLENVDVIGDMDDDVFEESSGKPKNTEKGCGNTKHRNDKNIPNFGSINSNSSSGYSSTEDEREKSNNVRLFRKAHDPRRHSIAPSTLNKLVFEKKDRRNSMVIKTTVKVGNENANIEEDAFIDSIQIDGKTIKSDRTLSKQNKKLFNRSDYRRHSTKAITHLYSSIINPRRQSSYIPSPSSKNVKVAHEHENTHNVDLIRPLSCSIASDATSIPKVVSATRVGYPRKISPLKKQHSFNKSNLSVGKKCHPCGNRFKIGAPSYKCSDCLVICHLECMHIAPSSCHSTKSNSKNDAIASEKYKNYFQSPLLFEADI